MVAYLTKCDASEGFNQIIDFLNGSYIKYALTVNPNTYVSCIKQFWNTVAIKQVNDVTRLQALVDKKRVVVTEAAIREVLRLDDAEGDLSTHTTKYALPTLTQKVFINMRRVGKGFSGVDTPLFEGMLVAQEIEEEGDADEHFKDVTAGDDAHGNDTAAHGEVPTVTQELSIPSPTPPTPLPQPPRDLPLTSQVQQTLPQSPQPQPQPQPQQPVNFPMSLLQEVLDACAALTRRLEHLEYDKGRMITKMDKDDVVVLMDDKEEDKKVEEAKVVESAQVQGRQAESQAEIYKINMDHANKVLSMQEDETKPAEVQNVIIPTAKPQVPAATLFAAPARVAAAPSRRRKGVVIRNPEEESTTSIIIPETKSKYKGKWILVEEPKPLKKKQQIEMDEEYARKLHAELNKDIDWDVAIDHMKLKAKEDLAVKRYQAMNRKPQIEAQARKNIMMYLKNVAGFKLDYFKGMSYDDIPKRRKLNEEVEDLKRHLEIVPDEDDDVYTKATPLARKFPVVDYEIIKFNNKPYYKIIRADGTHQLYISFLTLLNNFDREDLEALWNLIKEKFSTAKPKNFSDDFLLTTHEAMFKKPDAHAQIWKNQRTMHGQAKVKSWKLLESCGVHIITFTTTQLILLIEKRPASMMVEYILHQAQEQDLDQAS
nr:hypothetical protein [Tanacetum cinerariifolium]